MRPALDEYGEPLLCVPDPDAVLRRHVERRIEAEVQSDGIAAWSIIGSFIGGSLMLANRDTETMVVLSLAALVTSVLATIRGIFHTSSDQILAKAALEDAESIRRVIGDAIRDACECHEYAGHTVKTRAFRHAAGERQRLSVLPPPEPTIAEAMEENAEQYAKDAPSSLPPRSIPPHAPEEIPLHVQIMANEDYRLDRLYDLGTMIKNEQSASVRFNVIRPLIVQASADNDRLIPYRQAYYGGASHLKPVADAFYRHHALLFILYEQCIPLDGLVDLHWMHVHIEHAFNLEVAGRYIEPDVLRRMRTELNFASLQRISFEYAHHWPNCTSDEQRMLDELDRHVTALERFCEDAERLQSPNALAYS